MQKNLIQLAVTVGDKLYQFLAEPDSPLEHVKEALFQFGKHIGQIEDAIKSMASSKDKDDQEPPAPAPQPVGAT